MNLAISLGPVVSVPGLFVGFTYECIAPNGVGGFRNPSEQDGHVFFCASSQPTSRVSKSAIPSTTNPADSTIA